MANIVDLDQTALKEQFDHALHCLPRNFSIKIYVTMVTEKI